MGSPKNREVRTSGPVTVIEILKAARARIEDPARWTYKAFAVDEYGGILAAWNEKAIRWCSWGAVIVESGSDATARADAVRALHAAANSLGSTSAAEHNDRGHEHALAMFDLAIAALEAT